MPLNWLMSMLLLSPFTYIHSRFIARRLQNVTKNSYNVFYNSVVSKKDGPAVDEEVLTSFMF